ncbi:MAG TPA: hypothetical protein VGU69_06515 [Rhizomicrobium sp.]|nr:hypothetical protein [Rhizomicrobium sp.]
MKLSPKAMRIVSYGVSRLDTQAKDAWAKWRDRYPDGVVSEEVAPIIDAALVALEHMVLEAARTPVSEDRNADLVNDISFIHAIHSDVKKQLHETRR